MGLYHIDPSRFHIKKDNLGLFDVLGLGILPGTLYEEVNNIKDILLKKESLDEYPKLKKHQEWINELDKKVKDDNIDDLLKEEIGQVYVKMLESANVFKFGSHEDFISMIEKAI
jgi:UDPglucose--hexose-1-phosphate uridylyltransferase